MLEQVRVAIIIHILRLILKWEHKTRDDCVIYRSIYGDAALGQANLQMIETARRFGSAAKFPGSGGAIVGLCLDESNMVCTII